MMQLSKVGAIHTRIAENSLSSIYWFIELEFQIYSEFRQHSRLKMYLTIMYI